MKEIHVEGLVGNDKTLHLILPKNVEEGPVEVILRAKGKPKRNGDRVLTSFFEKVRQSRIPARSKEEIDRALQEERNSWDE